MAHFALAWCVFLAWAIVTFTALERVWARGHGRPIKVQGSSSTYTLSRAGNVYVYSCPAWKNRGAPIDAR